MIRIYDTASWISLSCYIEIFIERNQLPDNGTKLGRSFDKLLRQIRARDIGKSKLQRNDVLVQVNDLTLNTIKRVASSMSGFVNR